MEPLTSRFPHSDLDLDFFARKFQIKVHKHCKAIYCAYSYHYILLDVVLIVDPIKESWDIESSI
jgi:hypothetical protein